MGLAWSDPTTRLILPFKRQHHFSQALLALAAITILRHCQLPYICRAASQALGNDMDLPTIRVKF